MHDQNCTVPTDSLTRANMYVFCGSKAVWTAQACIVISGLPLKVWVSITAEKLAQNEI
jgi:hypothetical protein